MDSPLQQAMTRAAKTIGKAIDKGLLGIEDYYYVRSSGEVIGPNPGRAFGKPMSKRNKKRQRINNLFTNRRDAERAAKLIRIALRINKFLSRGN